MTTEVLWTKNKRRDTMIHYIDIIDMRMQTTNQCSVHTRRYGCSIDLLSEMSVHGASLFPEKLE